ncbi:MAG: hypothetical protein EOM24_26880 [Chloroflexia bacterium]|nr:hypothetical protein [Chloroflexia bacterium]
MKSEIEAKLTGDDITTHGHESELAALGTMFTSGVTAKSGAYTVATTDRGQLLDCTGTWTLTLPAAATATAGFAFAVRNSGSGVITIDGNGSETVDGELTITLAAGASAVIVCTGTAWLSVGLAAPIEYPISVANGGTGSGETPTASNSPQADNIKAVKHDHGHNNVGSLCFAAPYSTATYVPGATLSGAVIHPAGMKQVGTSVEFVASGTLSGTWRLLGYSSPSTSRYCASLWQRIA